MASGGWGCAKAAKVTSEVSFHFVTTQKVEVPFRVCDSHMVA